MNQKPTLRQDNALRLKIILILSYGVIMVVMIFLLGESGVPLVSQLVLQLGSIFDGAPVTVQP